MKQSKRNRVFNDARKLEMRKSVKQVRKLLAEEKVSEAEELIPETYKAIDKAAKRGVIKSNTADRKKSRLMAAVKKSKK